MTRRASSPLPTRSCRPTQIAKSVARKTAEKATTIRISPKVRELAQELKACPVAFIEHPQFRRRTAERWLESQRPSEVTAERRSPSSTVGVAFVSGLVQAPLLTPEWERFLFLKMNFLKYQAEQLRRKIDPETPDVSQLRLMQRKLAEANDLRNRIVESNLRLVVSVAKKLSNSIHQLSELTSEGLLPLMRAVELFDVHLGNRFSTYATWAIRNQMHRVLFRQRKVSELQLDEDDVGWAGIPDTRGSTTADLQKQTQRVEVLSELIANLNDRERKIIAARFGLEGHPAGQSLAEISADLGLSKERIRQIAIGAIEKLRTTAQDLQLDLGDQMDCHSWNEPALK